MRKILKAFRPYWICSMNNEKEIEDMSQEELEALVDLKLEMHLAALENL